MWDLVMAGAQVGLNLCLLPTVFRATSYVPRFTSGTTTIGLAIVAVSLLHLGAPVAAVSAAVGSALWVCIFFLRGRIQ
jgi:hypothetical protein